MTFDEQAATLDRKSIVELLVSQQQLTTSFKALAANNETLSTRNQELTRQLD